MFLVTQVLTDVMSATLRSQGAIMSRVFQCLGCCSVPGAVLDIVPFLRQVSQMHQVPGYHSSCVLPLLAATLVMGAAGRLGATVAQCATIATSGMMWLVSQVLLLSWVLLVSQVMLLCMPVTVSVMGVAGVSGGLLSPGPQVAWVPFLPWVPLGSLGAS